MTMKVPDSTSICERAKLFYYDLLSADATEPIPAEVQDHVRICEHCRQEMNNLKDTLSSVKTDEDDDPLRSTSVINQSLTLQFSLAGQEVSCMHIKPFVAILNLEGLKTNIPTPVTAHLNHCPACVMEFKTIQKLGLKQSQLRRLARLFSETVRPDTKLCTATRDRIPRLAAMEPEDCTPELLDHICRCRVCRELLYSACWDRFRILTESSRQSEIDCKRIEAPELFDLAVTYGLKAEDLEKMFLPNSVASHIKTCPHCMKKVLDLHQVIYTILDRRKSGVTTRFRLADSKKEETGNEKPRELYRDWPVEITVTGSHETSKEIVMPKDQSDVLSKANQKEKRKSYTWLLQKRIAYPAAAAAIVLIALSLIFYTTPATAISIDQIRAALVKIDAVHISKWEPDRTEPTQETWISRPANLYLNKTGNVVVYWDFANKGTLTRDLSVGTIEFKAAAPESLEKARSYMKSALGLVPPPGLSNASKNITWKRITVEAPETKTAASALYELEWKESGYGGTEVLRKWRGYIDPDTHLPLRIEWFKKTPNDDCYTLETISTLEYLSNAEIQAAINQYLP
jgi:hypothetical protein